jgi:transcriptional regulator with XRE-family HTH domain
MKTESKTKLSELVKKARGKETLTSFGKKLNVSYTAVLYWENGTSMPDRENLEKIAKISGYTLEELIEYLEGKKSEPSQIDTIIRQIKDMPPKQLALVTSAVGERMFAIAESVG